MYDDNYIIKRYVNGIRISKLIIGSTSVNVHSNIKSDDANESNTRVSDIEPIVRSTCWDRLLVAYKELFELADYETNYKR